MSLCSLRSFALFLTLIGLTPLLHAQCTSYSITVGGGTYDYEIDWELVNDMGVIVASGLAPANVITCQPDGCYTLYMYDSFGDGWNGATYTIQATLTGVVVANGTLANGGFGTAQVSLGGGCTSGNCADHTLVVTAGAYPFEVGWDLDLGLVTVASGSAPATLNLCLDTGCYTMMMYDSFGDGWNGSTWTLTDSLGVVVGSGTLNTGSFGQQTFPVGVPSTNCNTSGPVTASDCADAVDICTNVSFSIDPNGIGSIDEVPPLGLLGNPDLWLGDLVLSAWGSDNWGCLRNNELNSTWMVVNVSQGGILEFTFGGLGTQAGFYDWIMYPYSTGTCGAIVANTLPPVRCNWNDASFGGTGVASVVPPGASPGNFEPAMNVATGDRYIICFSNWSSVTTQVPLEFGGTAVVSCTPIVLPIELLSFSATAAANRVDLAWRTATEQNSAFFEVQRSQDLLTWTPLVTLDAAGNSATGIDYATTDPDPLPGENYYRLRMVDLDGTEEHSPVASAWWEGTSLLVYPNPNTGVLWIQAPGNGDLRVIDASGREVWSGPAPAGARSSRVRLPAPGVYTVLHSGTQGMMAEKVVVQQR